MLLFLWENMQVLSPTASLVLLFEKLMFTHVTILKLSYMFYLFI